MSIAMYMGMYCNDLNKTIETVLLYNIDERL
jgi:hypothetical protein